MKKIYSLLVIFFALLVLPIQARAAEWTTPTPPDFLPITWAKARGISSFYKAQRKNGYLDYLTVIYLPYNQIRLIASSTPTESWGIANTPFDVFSLPTIANWVFPKIVTEETKTLNPDALFIWNMPYFNITGPTSDLSLALKSTLGSSPYVTSGSRPGLDVAEKRRMLIIDNNKLTAEISDFDVDAFINRGDQAVEGFAPSVSIKADGAITSRLFVGVRAEGKELVVYCSRGATAEEAAAALTAAGTPSENQIQVDGGASATCAYNLPGQYFVEPGRMLTHLVGAFPVLPKAVILHNAVNVRAGPSTSNKSLKKLSKGDLISIYEEKNNWVRIDKSEQWVYKPLIKQN